MPVGHFIPSRLIQYEFMKKSLITFMYINMITIRLSGNVSDLEQIMSDREGVSSSFFNFFVYSKIDIF